jgi:hypothetical protein
VRQIGVVLIVWLGVAVVAFVGLDGVFGGRTFLAVTRPDVLMALAAVPLVVAALFWPPWGVAAVVIVQSPWILEMILAADDPLQFWPVAAALLVIDAYSIGLAWQREATRRQDRARAAFEQLGRLAAEAPAIADFADAVQEYGTDVAGEGRLRIWVLEPAGQVLRQIASGDEAVVERMGRKGQRSADLPSFALSAPDPCAQAAQFKQIVAVADRQAGKYELTPSERMAAHDGYRSLLAVPMLNHDRLVGVLTFEPRGRRPHAFGPRERASLQSIASPGAVAIESTGRHAD